MMKFGKKAVVWVLLIVMLLAVGCGAKPAPAPAPETPAQTEAQTPVDNKKLEEIKAKGKLVMGTSADYPPYEFHKMIDGKDTYVGFDFEISKAIAKEIGVELEIVDMKFDGLLPSLSAGKIDMIVAGMNVTEKRKESVDFSMPYYDAQQTMLVRTADASVLNTEESFVGKKIGVQKGTTQERIANERFTKSEVVAMPKIPDMVMALEAGKIDCIILNDVVAENYDKASEAVAVNGLDLGNEGDIAIAMPKDSVEFKAVVDKVLTQLIESGELKQMIADACLAVE